MEFPSDVIEEIGYGLYLAQMGDRHIHAKTLSGLGNAKIVEIRENDRSGTYRVIYTVEMDDFIFVLHAFQKKSKSGIATPKQELNIIRSRLKEAEYFYKELKGDE
ncbi:MAG: type II toxin-antitoxin system RelE/ParE family toxin [Parachlamydiaceae bacterium]